MEYAELHSLPVVCTSFLTSVVVSPLVLQDVTDAFWSALDTSNAHNLRFWWAKGARTLNSSSQKTIYIAPGGATVFHSKYTKLSVIYLFYTAFEK